MPKIFRIALVGAVATVAILGAFFTDSYWPQIQHQFMLATTHQPERFTELFFVNTGQIPSAVHAGQTLPIAFTIHNLEAEDITYTYKLIFTDAKGSVSLGEGQAAIPNSQSQTIYQTITVPAGQGRGSVDVQLIGRSQQIHLWLERS